MCLESDGTRINGYTVYSVIPLYRLRGSRHSPYVETCTDQGNTGSSRGKVHMGRLVQIRVIQGQSGSGPHGETCTDQGNIGDSQSQVHMGRLVWIRVIQKVVGARSTWVDWYRSG